MQEKHSPRHIRADEHFKEFRNEAIGPWITITGTTTSTMWRIVASPYTRSRGRPRTRY
jgi:hypothetical protein